jgi:hypothetical protein
MAQAARGAGYDYLAITDHSYDVPLVRAYIEEIRATRVDEIELLAGALSTPASPGAPRAPASPGAPRTPASPGAPRTPASPGAPR